MLPTGGPEHISFLLHLIKAKIKRVPPKPWDDRMGDEEQQDLNKLLTSTYFSWTYITALSYSKHLIILSSKSSYILHLHPNPRHTCTRYNHGQLGDTCLCRQWACPDNVSLKGKKEAQVGVEIPMIFFEKLIYTLVRILVQ